MKRAKCDRLCVLQHQVIASGVWLNVFGSHLEDLDQLRLDPDLATSKEYQAFNVSYKIIQFITQPSIYGIIV